MTCSPSFSWSSIPVPKFLRSWPGFLFMSGGSQKSSLRGSGVEGGLHILTLSLPSHLFSFILTQTWNPATSSASVCVHLRTFRPLHQAQ